jgi:hypothetical protein
MSVTSIDEAGAKTAPAALHRLASWALIIAAGIAIGLLLGKDVSWDQRHFHYYLGFSALNDRFGLDFYPASVQSYVVPWAFVPFYVLASSGVPDQLIVALLSVVPALGLCVIWEIGGRTVGAVTGQRFHSIGAWLSVAIAGSSPIVLGQIGNTFIDGPTATFVIAGFALLLHAVSSPRPDLRLVALAAAAMGVASALKLSNVVPAVASGVILLWILPNRRLVASAALVYGAVGIASTVAVAGPWWWRVYQAFGNPTLPAYNSIFRSDAANVDAGAGMLRFRPVDWEEALLRPLWMASPEKAVYVDTPAPDLRFAVLTLLLTSAAVVLAIRLRSKKLATGRGGRNCSVYLGGLAAAMCVSWPLWLMSSGNGRYFLPMLLLVGPVIVGLAYWLTAVKRMRFYVLFPTLGLQCLAAYWGSQIRYEPVGWSGDWYGVEVPATLKNEPAVLLSMAVESGSLIVPSLHRASSFVNAGGQFPLTPQMPAWRFVEPILEQAARRAYVVLPVQTFTPKGDLVRPRRERVDALASPFGMASTSEACEEIWVRGVTTTLQIQDTSSSGDSGRFETRSALWVACPVQRIAAVNPDIELKRRAADDVFNRLEQQCPVLFPKPSPFTVSNGDNWTRFYNGTDVMAWMTEKEVAFYRPTFYQARSLGSPETVLRGEAQFPCNLHREPIPIRWAK